VLKRKGPDKELHSASRHEEGEDGDRRYGRESPEVFDSWVEPVEPSNVIDTTGDEESLKPSGWEEERGDEKSERAPAERRA
jgi:hypothetical protein